MTYEEFLEKDLNAKKEFLFGVPPLVNSMGYSTKGENDGHIDFDVKRDEDGRWIIPFEL